MIDDMNRYTKGVRERQAELDAKQVAEAMKEPTLTCSEVVERLAAYIVDDLLERHPKSAWKHYIERALHSWRERRVQELEEALRQIAAHHYANEHIQNLAKRALTNLEWREKL